jgi:hypothetical protein
MNFSEARGDWLFFMMAICGQQYSELEKIPEGDSELLMDAFNRWITKLFGSEKKNKVREFALNVDPKAFEEMWRPKP